MERDVLRSWATRWKRVAEEERRLLRETSADERFRQVAALMQSAIALDWRTKSEDEVRHVRRRWLRLREVLGGKR